MKNNIYCSRQSGSVVLYVIAGMAILGMLAIMGSSVFSTIISGNQRSNLSIASAQTLTQAAYVITTEANTAGSYPVTSAILVASPAPTGGGQIYAASASPKIDGWGTAIGYCVYAAAAQGDPVFAVVSAGADKTFSTTCAQALVGTAAGDDIVRYKTAINIKQGVGGTVFYGDPVNAVGDLATLTPRVGEMRLVKTDGVVYINPTGTAGAASPTTWFVNQGLQTITAGANCDAFPAGAMGKDAAGDIYTCK